MNEIAFSSDQTKSGIFAEEHSLVFLTGTDKETLLRGLLEDGAGIKAIILPFQSQREARLAPVIKLAEEKEVAILRPKRTELRGVLVELAPDLLISAGYPYLLKPEHLEIARHNINIHPTLLPKYRGPATTWYIIANGDREGGVTVHHIAEGMDTGSILAQRRFPLGPFDTLRSYMRKAGDLEPLVLREALSRLFYGESRGEAQDENKATTYLETRTAEDSRLDPSRSLLELYDFIRACDPDRFPAFFEVEGEAVGIRFFRLEKPAEENDLL